MDRERQAASLMGSLRLLTKEEGIWRADLRAVLNGEARNLRDLWGIDTGKEIDKARFTLRAVLNAYLVHLKRPTGRVSGKEEDRASKFVWAYRVSFNLVDEHPNLRDLDLTRRREWLAETHGVELPMAGRDRDDAIRQIAQLILNGHAVLSMPPDVDNGEQSLEEKSTAQNQYYVRRNRIHHEFASLMQNGAHLIALVGQAGMGKSRLAEALVRDWAPKGERIPLVRFLSGETVSKDVKSSLLARGEIPGNSGALEQLVSLVSGPEAPKFVILDNLESAEELRYVLPAHINTIVVATCRSKGNFPADCQIINVGTMEPAEAMQMISRRLPDISESARTLLTKRLHGYPLVIRYATDLIGQTGVSVEEFCASLPADNATLAGAAPTEEGRTLRAVLEQTYRLVVERDATAHALLKCIALTHKFAGVDRTFTKRYWITSTGSAYSAVRYTQGLNSLINLGLAQTDYFPGYPYQHWYGRTADPDASRDCLTTHPLTRAILRDLVASEMAEFAQFLLTITPFYEQKYAECASVGDLNEALRFRTYFVCFFGELLIDGDGDQIGLSQDELTRAVRLLVSYLVIFFRPLIHATKWYQDFGVKSEWVRWARDRVTSGEVQLMHIHTEQVLKSETIIYDVDGS